MTLLFPLRHTANRLIVLQLVYLILGLPGCAQQVAVSAPLTAGEVVERLSAMDSKRLQTLDSYSSVRTYHLVCHCLSHKEANMVVQIDYHSPDTKQFTVLSESGSGTVRERVFKELIKAEQESMLKENRQQSAITQDNYAFQLVDYEKTDAGEYYVLDARPLKKNKFLFRGRIWVDAKEFAITRIEGEPAVNPSWWTEKTDFTRTYQQIGDYWLPEANESHTKVRIFGTAVLTIHYRDYRISPTCSSTLACSHPPRSIESTP